MIYRTSVFVAHIQLECSVFVALMFRFRGGYSGYVIDDKLITIPYIYYRDMSPIL